MAPNKPESAKVGLADQDAGWNATLLDDTICAFYINIDRDDPEFSGGANGNASAMDINVKDAVRTVKCNFDIHADGYQQRFGGVNENVIIAGEDWQIAGQLLFLSATEQDFDYTVVNNAFRFLSTAAEYIEPSSNLGREPKNNVVIAHNSWIDQQLRFRYDLGVTLDDYCLIANNVVLDLVDVGTSPTGAGIILNNHLYSGTIEPGGASGTTMGGDASSLFADAAGGDFAPAGDLLTNGRAPVLTFDAKGNERKEIDAVGAAGSDMLAVSEAPPPQPPKNTYDFTVFAAATVGTGQAEIVNGTLARALRTNSENAGALALPLTAGTYRIRCTLSEWTGNGSPHLRIRKGTLTLPVNVTPDSVPDLYFAAGAVDTTVTFAEADNLLLGPSSNGRSCELAVGSDPLIEGIA